MGAASVCDVSTVQEALAVKVKSEVPDPVFTLPDDDTDDDDVDAEGGRKRRRKGPLKLEAKPLFLRKAGTRKVYCLMILTCTACNACIAITPDFQSTDLLIFFVNRARF